jgi:hypothetical protein
VTAIDVVLFVSAFCLFLVVADAIIARQERRAARRRNPRTWR